MYTKKWLPSPFFESRGNYPLDMIIIHHIGSDKGKLYSVKGTLTWFTNIDVHKNPSTGKIENKVSAHYVLPRERHDGNDIYHLVKDTDIAYHAGVSQWTVNDKLRKYINRYSIGIEMEGDGNLVDYTDYQYDVLTWVVKDLMDRYDIREENIVGHEDIAPKRKVDPGKFFDWKKFRTMLNPPIIISTGPNSIEITPIPTENQRFSQAPPNDLKPPTTVPTEEKEFFMADGSKTHGGFMQIVLKFLSALLGKAKNQ